MAFEFWGGGGVARGGFSRYFNTVCYGGRSVLINFWADYHLGGSKRGRLGRSDCIPILPEAFLTFASKSSFRPSYQGYWVMGIHGDLFSPINPLPDSWGFMDRARIWYFP